MFARASLVAFIAVSACAPSGVVEPEARSDACGNVEPVRLLALDEMEHLTFEWPVVEAAADEWLVHLESRGAGGDTELSTVSVDPCGGGVIAVHAGRHLFPDGAGFLGCTSDGWAVRLHAADGPEQRIARVGSECRVASDGNGNAYAIESPSGDLIALAAAAENPAVVATGFGPAVASRYGGDSSFFPGPSANPRIAGGAAWGTNAIGDLVRADLTTGIAETIAREVFELEALESGVVFWTAETNTVVFVAFDGVQKIWEATESSLQGVHDDWIVARSSNAIQAYDLTQAGEIVFDRLTEPLLLARNASHVVLATAAFEDHGQALVRGTIGQAGYLMLYEAPEFSAVPDPDGSGFYVHEREQFEDGRLLRVDWEGNVTLIAEDVHETHATGQGGRMVELVLEPGAASGELRRRGNGLADSLLATGVTRRPVLFVYRLRGVADYAPRFNDLRGDILYHVGEESDRGLWRVPLD